MAALAVLPTEKREVRSSGAGHTRIMIGDLLGQHSDRVSRTPQAFLVDMIEPESVIHPHFHSVDQFQLAVGGSGRLGKHELKPATIHYSDAYMPYGPIVAGKEGLAYLTIRARHDAGAKYMPESAHLRKRRRQRAHFLKHLDTEHPQSGTIAGPFDDGLKISRAVHEGGAAIELDAPEATGGVYGVVLGGELVSGGVAYPQWSCVWVAPGEVDAGAVAGAQGLDLLLLQFPVPLSEVVDDAEA